MKHRREVTGQGGHMKGGPLSRSKRKLFAGIMISLPFLILVLAELTLRLLSYGGDLDLFIPGPEAYSQYLRCNPNVARRYFTSQSVIPSPPKQLFLKKKPKNGYRIFILGESSAAGFPYETNASFPGILERALSRTFPEKRIEVVNVSMSAISSYALLDLTDEIMEQSPDALLIYTGHNEYYGALGVGSVQSLGNSRWVVRLYLKLQSFRTFLILRDIIGIVRGYIGKIFRGGNENAPSATLMEAIVAEQTIPYGSELYEAGREQLKENMEAILKKATGKKVPVVIGELVSNLRDQPPFISVKGANGQSADSYFALARAEEGRGEFLKARSDYIKAKDLDGLRFRAPEEFNRLLDSLAVKYSCAVAPVEKYFEEASPDGIIGSPLMLEHLHPNLDGYFILAEAFYEAMKANRMIADDWPADRIDSEKGNGITELDSVYGALVVQHLKAGWPFRPRYEANRFIRDFRPGNLVEQIAFKVLHSTDFSLEAGHMRLGEYYEVGGESEKALLEYEALIASIPPESEFYEKAATLLLREKRYDEAAQLLKQSLIYNDNPFAFKWLGQIALINRDFKGAISYLEKSDSNDAQAVFNLSRAYYFDRQLNKGDELYARLQTLSPPADYISYLAQLRAAVYRGTAVK